MCQNESFYEKIAKIAPNFSKKPSKTGILKLKTTFIAEIRT